MKLKNKKTGEIMDDAQYRNFSLSDGFGFRLGDKEYYYHSLAELNEEWEDYEEHLLFFTRSIRDAIRAWWKLQENPFKCASVLCINDKKDKDGFYNYHIYGYIREGENKIATEFQFRTKCYYEYEHHKDYTFDELCGAEDEQRN